MSKSKRSYTRRAFMVLGGAAVGTVTMAGTANADTPHKKIHEAIHALKECVNTWSTPITTSVVTKRRRWNTSITRSTTCNFGEILSLRQPLRRATPSRCQDKSRERGSRRLFAVAAPGNPYLSFPFQP